MRDFRSITSGVYTKKLNMPENIHLTILVPSYNESSIIEDSLKEINGFLDTKKYLSEIVVVDDGSKDNSAEIVKNLKLSRVKPFGYQINRGKGGALKEGILHSQGKYVIFTDVDLSVPIGTADELLKELEKGESDVVIGTRKIKSARVLVHQPWLRENLGKGFTFITRIITGVAVSDFTCGFKGFTGESAKKIFGNSLLARWAYDAEILYLAKKFGYKIKEVPVTWTNRKDTRVKLWNAVITSLGDLLQLKLNDWSGKYDKA